MKKLIFILCTYLISALSLYAQERKALEDSVIVGGIPRSVVDMVLGADQMTPDEKLLAHWAYAELMKDISREHLALFSDQELSEILDYYRSDAFRFLNSDTFLTVYVTNITKAIQYEIGQGPKFSYILNDKSYGAGLEQLFKVVLSAYDPILDKMLGEDSAMILNARKAGLPDSQIKILTSALVKVIDNLFNIYRLSVVDYLSDDALKDYDTFMLSPVGQKFAIYTQKVKNIADVSSEEFLSDFSKRLETGKMSVSEMHSSIADYVALSRSFPLYFPELYRPHAEIVTKGGIYEGQTRDMVPHGKGKLTDKKGVVYEGDFRDGKRHGLLMVAKPGKEPVPQFWISDKYKKDVPLAVDENGVIPQAYVLDGQRYGYGSVYDQDTQSRLQGFFIDGQLNGKGKVFETGRTVEGDFIDGSMVSGTIVWEAVSDRVSVFKGRLSGNMGNGVREWTRLDRSEREMHMGTFEDGLMEGEGYKSIMQMGSRIYSSGIYAYGKQYGTGTYNANFTSRDTGIAEEFVYEGGFYADAFHGEGDLHMTLKNIPEGSWTFTRCNVRLPEVNADSLEIFINGVFEDGSFKKGKISYSDGSWYEGTFDEAGIVEGAMLRIYSDGTWYQGECRLGKCHGMGEIHYVDGTVYSGVFEYGSPVQQEQKNVTKAAKTVTGSDLRYDEQIFKYENLSVGKGKAALIKPAGVKIMVRTIPDLEVTCTGRFKDRTLVQGKVAMTDGNWLEGVFEDGVLITGRGRTVDKYGTIYEGEIKNGYPHGEGICTYADKTWFKGNFANGNRMGGTHYAADGKVIKVYK